MGILPSSFRLFSLCIVFLHYAYRASSLQLSSSSTTALQSGISGRRSFLWHAPTTVNNARNRRRRHLRIENRVHHDAFFGLSAIATLQDEEAWIIDEASESVSNLDSMRARAGVLRVSILKQQLELQRLERSIVCCSQGIDATDDQDSPFMAFANVVSTFIASANVLTRKLGRVQNKTGKNNQKWDSPAHYVAHQTATGARIVSDLVQNPIRLMQLVDPDTHTLVPHVPAILARLDKLESHVAPILERVLNNRRHLGSIEPYLPEILERFDDIEPHLPWILENIDTLAPYTGLLLKHIDELLIYAEADPGEGYTNNYELAQQLLPYLEYYVSRLDVIGPHLILLRPHVPLLLQHNRIGKISPHIERLFAAGYSDLSASANMDVLIFWFGWTLSIPGLPRLFFALPASPRIVSFLANRLPKRFCRGYCRDVTCDVGGDYGGNWNQLTKET